MADLLSGRKIYLSPPGMALAGRKEGLGGGINAEVEKRSHRESEKSLTHG